MQAGGTTSPPLPDHLHGLLTLFSTVHLTLFLSAATIQATAPLTSTHMEAMSPHCGLEIFHTIHQSSLWVSSLDNCACRVKWNSKAWFQGPVGLLPHTSKPQRSLSMTSAVAQVSLDVPAFFVSYSLILASCISSGHHTGVEALLVFPAP